MSRLIYSKNDYFFYKWWKNIYMEQMDLYEKFSNPGVQLTENDFNEWNLLRAYFFGLCDGRKRICEGPK